MFTYIMQPSASLCNGGDMLADHQENVLICCVTQTKSSLSRKTAVSRPFSQATAAQRGGRHFDINRRVLPAFDPLGVRMCNSDGDKSTKQIFF